MTPWPHTAPEILMRRPTAVGTKHEPARGPMSTVARLVFCTALGWSMAAGAAPFLPATDDQVVERLPYKANDPATASLRAARARLRLEPDNLRLAVYVAQGYLEQGRRSGDPRYAGYAQAALMPWWTLAQPPQEVLLLRAILEQRVHAFDAALADLDTLLERYPKNAQARLTRATVLQVRGMYPPAANDCVALQRLADPLVARACLASIDSVSGRLRDSYQALRSALAERPDAEAALRSWILTSLAEMASRAGLAREADDGFREALAGDRADVYLLGAYADFLLDQGRPREVIALLQDDIRADPLLLRYALALKAVAAPESAAYTAQLRARFDASRLRGDRVHLREEARFALHLASDAPAALTLAEDNWAVQKEVADLRILLEAALATHSSSTLAAVADWLRLSHLEDAQIARLMASVPHPA